MKETRNPLNPVAAGLEPPRGELASYPPVERWDDWKEYDAASWPKKVERRYSLIPTICFNCEAACGLLAYVDKDRLSVKKFEGNPLHPGSRGRNCAKGPATINQVSDPERIRYPLKRAGKRGEGKWERVSWDEVLDDIAARVRKALVEDRRTEIMYHVGRPGHELVYHQRILHAWGIDGHNSHTNVCSAGARAGYAFWHGLDRPSPDHANARFILLLSSHLETGHYFNPHAQRIIEAKMKGAKICAVDTRLSNTASMADYWLAPWPGSEAALLLAMCNVILKEGLYDRAFLEKWINWDEYLREEYPDKPRTFESFISILKEIYGQYTPEFAEKESGVKAGLIVEVAREVGRAGSALATHVWRNAAAGNLGGWQVARALEFLTVLVGAVATPGGTAPSGWNKFVPAPPLMPPPAKIWNEMLLPREYPLAFFEMSFLLPHFLKEGRGKLAMYFTRVYNPVWTNPDGMSWIEALTDESKVERHACLTPTWSETAWFADYVLPMGHASERHDLMSQETHAARWIGFRQPVLRVALERQGKKFNFTYEAHREAGLGEIWEEDEFWIELSWKVDPDGSLGIRKYFESPYEPGKKLTVEDYYRWIFENSVPGLPESAAKEGLTPLEYMRKYGAFLIEENVYRTHETRLKEKELEGSALDPVSKVITKAGSVIGVEIDAIPCTGFPTPSRKLEFFSKTLKEWKWPEHAVPGYIKSHVHREQINQAKGEMLLLPTFRLPTLIHTRSGNAKWLYEISHKNPLWLHTKDAERLGVKTGELLKVHTEIGYFVDKVWVTEGIRPGVVACSHHLGRWRLKEEMGGERWSTALVDLKQVAPGQWMMRQIHGIRPFKSDDPDSERIWWEDGGVHQNLTFPVQPDFISGQHCWHQKVRVEGVGPEDRYGDIFVDTNKSHEVYKRWLKMTRPALGPNNLRRPLWLPRSYKPAVEAYYLPPSEPE
ncbi:MAG: molybdopterin-dependent oxidoreductase [Deltaproteobacteria bacterium]|nr:molybdopterin-dependent oxidoreductase [Deltaproteobacteria bacterium]MBI3063095.1 molybdopterin-dependent oxidoreductase [Deltaproteobacteria bacterium]